MAKSYQTYESLRLVVHEALGGKSQPKATDESDEAIGTYAELVQAFTAIGGSVGG